MRITNWIKLIDEHREDLWKHERILDTGALRVFALGKFMESGSDEFKQVMGADFDAGWGGSNGIPFTAWSEERVYFPQVYDGAESVRSVPRNPSKEATEHVGGQ